jgi:hypothetical protein
VKSTELRIGNHAKDPYGKEIKLVTVDKDASMLSPIPLTEEWLLKFGFVENTTSWTRWRKPIGVKEIRLTKNGVNRVTYNGMRMNHIHQLQNLYHALTGEEL